MCMIKKAVPMMFSSLEVLSLTGGLLQTELDLLLTNIEVSADQLSMSFSLEEEEPTVLEIAIPVVRFKADYYSKLLAGDVEYTLNSPLSYTNFLEQLSLSAITDKTTVTYLDANLLKELTYMLGQYQEVELSTGDWLLENKEVPIVGAGHMANTRGIHAEHTGRYKIKDMVIRTYIRTDIYQDTVTGLYLDVQLEGTRSATLSYIVVVQKETTLSTIEKLVDVFEKQKERLNCKYTINSIKMFLDMQPFVTTVDYRLQTTKEKQLKIA